MKKKKADLEKEIERMKKQKESLKENDDKLKEKQKQKLKVDQEVLFLKNNRAINTFTPDKNHTPKDDELTETPKTNEIKKILKEEQEKIDAIREDQDRKAQMKTILEATLAKLKADPCNLKESDDVYKQVVELHKSRMQPFTDLRPTIGVDRLDEITKARNARLQRGKNSLLSRRGANFEASRTDVATGEKIFVPFSAEKLQQAKDRLVLKQNPDIEYVETSSGHSLTILSNELETLQEAVALCSAQGCNTLDLNPSEHSCSVDARHELAAEALRQDYYHVKLHAEKNDKKGLMWQQIFDIKSHLARRNPGRKETDWAELFIKLGDATIVYKGTFGTKTANGSELQKLLIETMRPEQIAKLIEQMHAKHQDKYPLARDIPSRNGPATYTEYTFYKNFLNKIAIMLMGKSVEEQNQYLLELKNKPELQTHLLNRLLVLHQHKLESMSPNTGIPAQDDGSYIYYKTDQLQWFTSAKDHKIIDTMTILTAGIDPRVRNDAAFSPHIEGIPNGFQRDHTGSYLAAVVNGKETRTAKAIRSLTAPVSGENVTNHGVASKGISVK